MKSTTGLHPLKQLPKEMWKKILDELDSKARGNMTQVHDVFSGLAEGTRIRDIYLPQILLLNNRTFHGELISSGSTELDRIFPIWNEYFNLRIVCKSVRDAVDKWIEDKLLHCMRTQKCNENEETASFNLTCEKDNIDYLFDIITTCLDVPPKERMKRFYPRSIIVEFPKRCYSGSPPLTFSELLNQFKTKITYVLEHIGNQVWHFKLKFSLPEREERRQKMSMPQLYMILREWLLLMPNLKWLQLYGDYDNMRKSPKPTKKKSEMHHALRNEPVPKLAHLERVDFKLQCEHEEFELYKALLEANPHVKILHLTQDMHITSIPKLPDHLLHRPYAIKSLPLEALILDVNMTFIMPCINFTWNLKLIELSWREKKSSLNDIFKFLNHFPSLENLTLTASRISVGKDLTSLNLPNLTHADLTLELWDDGEILSMDFDGNIHVKVFSLHFLLPCSKLRSIEWTNCLVETEENLKEMERCCKENACMDFYGGWRDLSDSNIWDVFPCLEYVAIRRHKRVYGRYCYFRRLFEEYRHRTKVNDVN